MNTTIVQHLANMREKYKATLSKDSTFRDDFQEAIEKAQRVTAQLRHARSLVSELHKKCECEGESTLGHGRDAEIEALRERWGKDEADYQ